MRQRGRGFKPHRRHCVVYLSKNINPSLVLVQPRKTRPFVTERLFMGRKESINKQNKRLGGISPNFTENILGWSSSEFKDFHSMQNSGCFGNQKKLLGGFENIWHKLFLYRHHSIIVSVICNTCTKANMPYYIFFHCLSITDCSDTVTPSTYFYSRLSLTQLCITQHYHLSRPDGPVPVFSPIYYCNSTTFISTTAKSK